MYNLEKYNRISIEEKYIYFYTKQKISNPGVSSSVNNINLELISYNTKKVVA